MSELWLVFSRNKGLQGQAESILGVMLDKSNRIRCGDWEADDFSQEQVFYDL